MLALCLHFLCVMSAAMPRLGLKCLGCRAFACCEVLCRCRCNAYLSLLSEFQAKTGVCLTNWLVLSVCKWLCKWLPCQTASMCVWSICLSVCSTSIVVKRNSQSIYSPSISWLIWQIDRVFSVQTDIKTEQELSFHLLFFLVTHIQLWHVSLQQLALSRANMSIQLCNFTLL